MSKEAYILKPTTYLLECELDQLSQVEVYQLTKKGFDLDKVQSMLATSALYSQKKIIQRIVGKSLRAIQSQHKAAGAAQRSAEYGGFSLREAA